jgi:Ca2+-binding EF-hand superfamily protein
VIIYNSNYFFFFKDLRQAFSSVDRDHDGFVRTKDIPVIFAYLDQTYKSFIVEGDDLKRLIDKVDIDGQFVSFICSY